MNRSPRRRAFTLMEVIALLPVMLALTVMAYMTITQVERWSNLENISRQDEAVLSDLVRRIQEDAGPAREAVAESPASQPAESPEAASTLLLRKTGGEVRYSANATGITREERPIDGPPVRYSWRLQCSTMAFQIESIRNRPSIIWMLINRDSPASEGPPREQKIAAAAMIRSGGEQ